MLSDLTLTHFLTPQKLISSLDDDDDDDILGGG